MSADDTADTLEAFDDEVGRALGLATENAQLRGEVSRLRADLARAVAANRAILEANATNQKEATNAELQRAGNRDPIRQGVPSCEHLDCAGVGHAQAGQSGPHPEDHDAGRSAECVGVRGADRAIQVAGPEAQVGSHESRTCCRDAIGAQEGTPNSQTERLEHLPHKRIGEEQAQVGGIPVCGQYRTETGISGPRRCLRCGAHDGDIRHGRLVQVGEDGLCAHCREFGCLCSRCRP
jgi:hypothetical protein